MPHLLASANPTPSWILITRQGAVTNAATLPAISIMASNAAGTTGSTLSRMAGVVGAPGDGPWSGVYWLDVHIDPRTDRFGMMGRVGSLGYSSLDYDPLVSETTWPGASGVSYYPVPNGHTSPPPNPVAFGVTSYMPFLTVTGTVVSGQTSAFFLELMDSASGVNYGQNNTICSNAGIENCISHCISNSSSQAFGRYMETIGDNLAPPYATAAQTSLNYYEDPDGITRPGVGAYTQSGNGTDGRPMAMNSSQTAMLGTSQPMILNRPFRSVAELGYTFRDEPWKDIDFFSSVSGDAALLEAFSIDDTSQAITQGISPIVAGKINLNTQNALALQAMLYGAIRDDTSYTASDQTISQTDAANIAATLVGRTSSTTAGSGPLQSKADLVTKFAGDLNNPSVYSVSSSDAVIKRRREAARRTALFLIFGIGSLLIT